ncbi:MAG: glycosyltransferase family 2 protein [Janthinobacterium lividum]
MSSVAVIIPAYNRADLLLETLRSVLAQTRPADEIIVIDDGSADNTAEVAASFPGVTVLRQANAGESAARNHGIHVATSEWVAFLDSDDVWRADKLQVQMDALAKSPSYDACTCNALKLLADGSGGEQIFDLPPSEKIAPGLRGSLRVPPGTVIVRRQLVLDVGGFEVSFRYAEDWEFWLRLVAAGCRFLLCPQPMLFIREHGNNLSNQSVHMMEGELRIWEKHLAPLRPAVLRPLYRRAARSHFLGRAALVEREQRRPHLGMMTRSLLHWPFGDTRRHRVFLHMLLTRLGLLRARNA